MDEPVQSHGRHYRWRLPEPWTCPPRARSSRRPNSPGYHSGWPGGPASAVITWSPPPSYGDFHGDGVDLRSKSAGSQYRQSVPPRMTPTGRFLPPCSRQLHRTRLQTRARAVRLAQGPRLPGLLVLRRRPWLPAGHAGADRGRQLRRTSGNIMIVVTSASRRTTGTAIC